MILQKKLVLFKVGFIRLTIKWLITFSGNLKWFNKLQISPSSPLKDHQTSTMFSLKWRFNVGFIGTIIKRSITFSGDLKWFNNLKLRSSNSLIGYVTTNTVLRHFNQNVTWQGHWAERFWLGWVQGVTNSELVYLGDNFLKTDTIFRLRTRT